MQQSNDLQAGLQNALAELNQQLGTDAHAREVDNNILVTTMAGASILLSAGFVSWALQGSSIATAFILTLPSWNNFDPLPVLDANAEKMRKLNKQRLATDSVENVFLD